MSVWSALGRGASRVRSAIRPTADALISIEGITSAGALVRAIDATMPRGATLWIDHPADDAVELFLQERSGKTPRVKSKSYQLPIRGTNLAMLARLVDDAPPSRIGMHLGVDHEKRRMLIAYDLDTGAADVGLSSHLPESVRRTFAEIAAVSNK